MPTNQDDTNALHEPDPGFRDIPSILQNKSIFTLRRLRGRSSALSKEIDDHLVERFEAIVQPYVDDLDSLTELLRANYVVLSGSTALQFIDPEHVMTAWSTPPKDLDLYTPRSRHSVCVNYFVLREGYEITRNISIDHDRGEMHRTSPLHRDAYRLTNDQMSVITTLKKDERSIDIIASVSESPLMPIFRFHSTFVMNAVTPDCVLVAYEQMTKDHHGLINQNRPLIPRLREKWENRGFAFLENSNQWNPTHLCRSVTYCSHTVRLTNDTGCFAWNFGAYEDAAASQLWGVLWRLGGPACSSQTQSSTSMLVHLVHLFDGYHGNAEVNGVVDADSHVDN